MINKKNRKKLLKITLLMLSTLSISTANAMPEMNSITKTNSMAEMQAIKRLVADEFVQFRTVINGNWTESATWEGGKIPTEGSNIAIDHEVIVNQIIPESFMSIRINGTLAFATDVNTELKVDTIVVDKMGKFEMGTETNPISEDVHARLLIKDANNMFNTTDDTKSDYDPKKLGQGLISLGNVTIHGSKKTGVATFNNAYKGSDFLRLDNLPADWKEGDILVIAGTQKDALGDEERTILAVDSVSNQVVFDKPLEFDHTTPTHKKEGMTLKIHVINLTRNATIESVSENNLHNRIVVYRKRVKTRRGMRWQKKYTYDNRGHVMFMHNNNVNIQYAGFNYLGRTNKLADIDHEYNVPARYSVHFHRAGDAEKSAVVHGNAVNDSMGWGYVNHSSSVDMTNNVAYNVRGAAFVSETGAETGSMVHNVSIRNHGRYLKKLVKGHTSQLGSLGNGFWIHSKRLDFRDNVSAGARHTAYHLWGILKDRVKGSHRVSKKYANDLEQVPNEQDTISINEPMTMSNNLAYGTNYALQFNWFAGVFVNDFTAYNVKRGVARPYSHNITFKDLTLINNKSYLQGRGVEAMTNASGFMYFNPHIEGFDTGIAFEGRQGSTGLRDGYFNNLNNIELNAMWKRSRSVLITGDIEFGKLSTDELQGHTQLDFSRNINGNTPRHHYFLQLDSMEHPYEFKMTAWDGTELESIKEEFKFVSHTRPEPIKKVISTFQSDLRRGVHLENLELSGTGSKLINLSDAFLYVQTEEMNPVSFSILRNTNPDIVTASIENGFLRLDYNGSSSDTMMIEVGAKFRDKGKRLRSSVSDTFSITFR